MADLTLTFEDTAAGPGPDAARIQDDGTYPTSGGDKLGSALEVGDTVFLFQKGHALTIATITPEA
ncbi:unnamed protein product [marine sediment metagenome]|uniref:Uncharacterized protein n=1 Tax=marine sediment metagenome TaxID=412755 RepID=X0V5F5_9ZZZZ